MKKKLQTPKKTAHYEESSIESHPDMAEREPELTAKVDFSDINSDLQEIDIDQSLGEQNHDSLIDGDFSWMGQFTTRKDLTCGFNIRGVNSGKSLINLNPLDFTNPCSVANFLGIHQVSSAVRVPQSISPYGNISNDNSFNSFRGITNQVYSASNVLKSISPYSNILNDNSFNSLTGITNQVYSASRVLQSVSPYSNISNDNSFNSLMGITNQVYSASRVLKSVSPYSNILNDNSFNSLMGITNQVYSASRVLKSVSPYSNILNYESFYSFKGISSAARTPQSVSVYSNILNDESFYSFQRITNPAYSVASTLRSSASVVITNPILNSVNSQFDYAKTSQIGLGDVAIRFPYGMDSRSSLLAFAPMSNLFNAVNGENLVGRASVKLNGLGWNENGLISNIAAFQSNVLGENVEYWKRLLNPTGHFTDLAIKQVLNVPAYRDSNGFESPTLYRNRVNEGVSNVPIQKLLKRLNISQDHVIVEQHVTVSGKITNNYYFIIVNNTFGDNAHIGNNIIQILE